MLIVNQTLGDQLLQAAFHGLHTQFAARVVDLPAPVGPVTRIRPLFNSSRFLSPAGNFRLFILGMMVLTTRKPSPTSPFYW